MGQIIETILLFLCLICFAIHDYRFRVLPGKWVMAAVGSSMLLRILYSPSPLWHYILAALCVGGIFLVVALLTNGGVGGGDIQLIAWVGLTIGLMPTLWVSAISCVLAIIYSFIGRKKGNFPFVPFMLLASVLVYLI